MGKGIHVTPQEYENIKELTNKGVSAETIQKYFQRSIVTIRLVRDSNDFDDYQVKRAEKTHKTEPKPQTVAAEPTPQMVTVVAERFLMEEVKKQTELLTTISAKLAFIVDELTK